MSTLPLSPQVFAILAALIEERTGLHFELDERETLATKLSPVAIEAGFHSLLDYYYALRYDDPTGVMFTGAIEALVVGETYFFRELSQLEVLVDEALRPLLQPGRRARVWFAACSSGEEPLTAAMMLADRGLLDRVELVGTDLSARALAIAKTGRYRPRSLRLPAIPRFAAPYLSITENGLTVDPSLIARVDWRRINLLDPAQIRSLGIFDVILCRNVLIYFRDETVVRVVENLCGALASGGSIFVGISESLLRFGTALTCDELSGAFCYRKAG